MKQCCQNCSYFESGGFCGLWKNRTSEITGFNDFRIGHCNRFKEKIMKCPIGIVNEFSEWSNTCQDCQHYADCMHKCYDIEKSYNTDHTNFGDNYPFFGNIHHKLDLNRDRQKMVIQLLKEDFGKITSDDILNTIIDIELYNKANRKEKIKRRYKEKKE
jgi:hypothetical protein